jgi:endogenous inhibitor of DNA gyrase (YacG/DUF329 family)
MAVGYMLATDAATLRRMRAGARSVCPICGRDAASRPQNAAFPFCSPQCKLVDLGRWLDGAYRVPGAPVDAEDGTDGPAGRARRGEEEDE